MLLYHTNAGLLWLRETEGGTMGWGTGVPIGFAAAVAACGVGAGVWFVTYDPLATAILALAGAIAAAWYTYKRFLS